jgi:DNA-binding NtrC family response regulator
VYGGETMKKIILINDCKFQSLIMKDMLIKLEYEVNITNEYGALVKIENFNPDIIICNLIMKDTTGDKLIKDIKNKNPKIICLLSSANSIRLEDYSKKYIDEVIHIPIEMEELENILSEFTNKPKKVQNLDNDKNKFSFCPFCGEKLKSAKENFSFCPFCGQKIK